MYLCVRVNWIQFFGLFKILEVEVGSFLLVLHIIEKPISKWFDFYGFNSIVTNGHCLEIQILHPKIIECNDSIKSSNKNQ